MAGGQESLSMDNRNLILAIAISGIILVVWNMMFPPPEPPVEGAPVATAPAQPGQPSQATNLPTATPPQGGQAVVPPSSAAISDAQAQTINQQALLAADPRIQVRSDRVTGSISLKGGRFDDVVLNNYNVNLNDESEKVRVLAPKGQVGSYFAEYGWVAQGLTADQLPGPDTLWQASARELTPENPVTLTWDNGNGLTFTRTISLDANFMFTIAQRVKNNSNGAIVLNPYALLSRWETPAVTGFFILHEGLLGVLDGTLTEVDYDELVDDGPIKATSTGGWLGMTDKYWLAALVPAQDAAINARFTYSNDGGTDKYQTDYLGPQTIVAPGAEVVSENRLFAGAKEVLLLDSYTDDEGISRFDLAIDFGWFYFLTKPIFYALNFFNTLIGSFGIGILLLTVMIKLAFFPLANKSYRAMAKMRSIQPELKELQARFKDNKTQLNQEMMALYKRTGANPAAGCLPIVVQIPVFFALYKVLFVSIESRHAPFFGWIQDLSAPDPTSMFNLFGLIPWTPPDFLMIGVWPLIMGLTMFMQQRLNPQPTDPVQAKVFMLMPIFFTFLLAPFPAGLVIYWAWNNSLSIAQQWTIMKRMGVK